MIRPPLPPFDHDTAAGKVGAAEDAWNRRAPGTVALAHTVDRQWRNRSEFLSGRAGIVRFLTRKRAIERDNRLIKLLWAFAGDRIAVRFAHEWDVNGMTPRGAGCARLATGTGRLRPTA